MIINAENSILGSIRAPERGPEPVREWVSGRRGEELSKYYRTYYGIWAGIRTSFNTVCLYSKKLSESHDFIKVSKEEKHQIHLYNIAMDRLGLLEGGWSEAQEKYYQRVVKDGWDLELYTFFWEKMLEIYDECPEMFREEEPHVEVMASLVRRSWEIARSGDVPAIDALAILSLGERETIKQEEKEVEAGAHLFDCYIDAHWQQDTYERALDRAKKINAAQEKGSLSSSRAKSLPVRRRAPRKASDTEVLQLAQARKQEKRGRPSRRK